MQPQIFTPINKSGKVYLAKHFPTTMLFHFKDVPRIAEFLKGKDLSVLDVGTSLPVFLYHLHHEFDFKVLNGIEALTEDEIVSFVQWVANRSQYFPIANTFGLYLAYTHEWLEENFSINPKIIDEKEYYKRFNVAYNLNTCNLMYSETPQSETQLAFESIFLNRIVSYDFLILSNVIHMQPDKIYDDERRDRAITFTNYFVDKLKKGGIIYAKVNHEDNPNVEGKNHAIYNEHNFINLFKDKFETLYYDIELGGNIHYKSSIIYFGIKN